jgi:hypothetical protein
MIAVQVCERRHGGIVPVTGLQMYNRPIPGGSDRDWIDVTSVFRATF